MSTDPNAWRVRLAYLYEAMFGFSGSTEYTPVQQAILSDLGKAYVPKKLLDAYAKEAHILEAKASPPISRPTRDAEKASAAHQAARTQLFQQRLSESRNRAIMRCSAVAMSYTKAKLRVKFEYVCNTRARLYAVYSSRR